RRQPSRSPKPTSSRCRETCARPISGRCLPAPTTDAVRRRVAALTALCLLIGHAAVASAQPAPQILKGLVFVAHTADARADGGRAAAPPSGVDVSRVPSLADARALRVLQPFIGQPFDVPTLQRIAVIVNEYFTDTGRPFVRVTLPPQEVVDGVVQ